MHLEQRAIVSSVRSVKFKSWSVYCREDRHTRFHLYKEHKFEGHSSTCDKNDEISNLSREMTSSWLKLCGLLLLISSLATGRNVLRHGRHNAVTENSEPNDLTPPQDPAINAFPKEPLVPLVPTCAHPGYFRDPYNCAKFYQCSDSGANPETYYCQHGWIFDEISESCDNPDLVRC